MGNVLNQLAGLALLAGAPALAQHRDSYQDHFERAQILAGSEYRGLLFQCTRLVDPPQRGRPGGEGQARPPAAVPAIKAFANLYFVGVFGVSAWALDTSEGIILIDALNNRREVEETLVAGLRRFGLDPADIKYVVVTHGHGDHYGGAQYIANTYGARVIASAEDWEVMTRPITPEMSSPNFDPPPLQGMTVADGEELTLGDTTIEFHVTPGHTFGTLSVVFPVRDRGQPHVVAQWGGTGFNFPPSPERFALYAQSAADFGALARDRGVDVILSNHPGNDATFSKGATLERRLANDPNPFVVGTDSATRFLGTLGECASANRAFLLANQL